MNRRRFEPLGLTITQQPGLPGEFLWGLGGWHRETGARRHGRGVTRSHALWHPGSELRVFLPRWTPKKRKPKEKAADQRGL